MNKKLFDLDIQVSKVNKTSSRSQKLMTHEGCPPNSLTSCSIAPCVI